jgi:uncharacterized protein (TIGR01777 family)
MIVAITGGSGFIGSRLIDTLQKDGHQVIQFSRKSKPRSNVVQWDSNSGPPPADVVGKADAIVHLAGEPIAQIWTDSAKERIRASRVFGTRNLVEGLAASRRKPQTLVCASAIGYYGSRGDEILTEDSPPGTGFLPDICIEWEREADRAARLGVRVVKLRTGLVLGKGGGALVKMLPIFRVGLGGTLGSGNQWMSWIHVDDIIGLIRHALHQPVTGAMNGVGPNPVTNAEFTRALGKAIHRPAFLPVPGFAVKLLTGEMSQIVLDSQRVLPQVAEKSGYSFRHVRVDTALRASL